MRPPIPIIVGSSTNSYHRWKLHGTIPTHLGPKEPPSQIKETTVAYGALLPARRGMNMTGKHKPKLYLIMLRTIPALDLAESTFDGKSECKTAVQAGSCTSGTYVTSHAPTSKGSEPSPINSINPQRSLQSKEAVFAPLLTPGVFQPDTGLNQRQICIVGTSAAHKISPLTSIACALAAQQNFP